jgi:hypothetical protein
MRWHVLGTHTFLAGMVDCLLEVVQVLTEVDSDIRLVLLVDDASLASTSKVHVCTLQEVEHCIRV